MAQQFPALEKDYTRAVANSPLFFLSGEVRNMIWRCFLHLDDDEEECIAYGYGDNAARELQAALVFTCHLIQQETAAIFYLENEYDIDCTGFNSDPLVALSQRFKTLGLAITEMSEYDPHAVYVEVDPVSWSSLTPWLERYHSGLVGLPIGPAFGPGSGNDTESSVIKAMFGMVDDLRCVEWGTVQAALERQRPILVGCYDKWSKEQGECEALSESDGES
ncbi:hypothetical protein LTR95_004896 [Oleoguttula sp. CCFEE 5521]